MLAQLEKRLGLETLDHKEDVSREDIVAAFDSAMVGYFRSHVPGTNINASTLLASDYLNHFHDLVMLIEAVESNPERFTADLLEWRPLSYEDHFSASGFRDKTLAVAAYRRAPPMIRASFDSAVARLHDEAVAIIAEVASELRHGGTPGLRRRCAAAVMRLRGLIDEAKAIACGETMGERVDPFADLSDRLQG